MQKRIAARFALLLQKGLAGESQAAYIKHQASVLPSSDLSQLGRQCLHTRSWWHPSIFKPQGQARSMFIQMHPTPNPASMMFMPGKTVMESGNLNIATAREAMKSPLARKLFQTDGVKHVFFGNDFVTVTKDDSFDWSVLKPDILAAIADHVSSGEPILLDEEMYAASDTAIHDDDSEVVAMIKELLETRIRPSVQEDGGDIEFRGFDESNGLVTLKMQGACSGCPSSSVTLKNGIENMLMHYIPEVKCVQEAPPDPHEDIGLQEFAKMESHLSN